MLHLAASANEKVKYLFNAPKVQDWQAISRFLSRVRQVCRSAKIELRRVAELKERQEFSSVKKAWAMKGKHVCRHGVFFNLGKSGSCPCLLPHGEADWKEAVLMPMLNASLKCIATDTFNQHGFDRLGVLRAEARRRNW